MKNISKITNYLKAPQKLWGERFESLPLFKEKASIILWKGSTERMSDSGCSWRSLLLTSWHKWPRSCGRYCDGSCSYKRKNWPGMWSLRKVLAAETMSSGVEFRTHRWSIKAKPGSQSLTLREDFTVQGPAWKYAMGGSPGGKNEFE